MASNCFLSWGTCHLADPAILLLYLSTQCPCRILFVGSDLFYVTERLFFCTLFSNKKSRPAIPMISTTEREHYMTGCSFEAMVQEKNVHRSVNDVQPR
jgi:hypothetical protein